MDVARALGELSDNPTPLRVTSFKKAPKLLPQVLLPLLQPSFIAAVLQPLGCLGNSRQVPTQLQVQFLIQRTYRYNTEHGDSGDRCFRGNTLGLEKHEVCWWP